MIKPEQIPKRAIEAFHVTFQNTQRTDEALAAAIGQLAKWLKKKGAKL